LAWFLADRTQRQAAPGTEPTLAALLVREETNAQWGRVSGADLVQHLLGLHSESGWLHAQLARLRLKQYGQQNDPGLLREVEWLTRRAGALSADHLSVWWIRADFLETSGDPTGAIEAFARASRLPDSSAGLTLAKAQCLERQGLLEPALTAYATVLRDARDRSGLGPGELRLAWLACSQLHSQLGNAEEARRARDRAYGLEIPPRDPLAPVRLIDLTGFYTGDLNRDCRASRFPGHDLSALGRGRQTLAGVEFDLRGVVQLSSVFLDARRLCFPRGIRGIPVAQRCRRLHFLHATDTAATAGDLVATYAVNYADGQPRTIPIRYGVEAFPWDWECTPTNPGTVVAWRGSNSARERVNLYCTTWTNPHPAVVVTTIDLESAMTSCAPMIVAITAD
jgi:tetratricopeptide (TPR) repeat protein